DALLHQGRGLLADEMRAEELAGLLVGDELRETVAVLEGPTVGDVAVVLDLHRDLGAVLGGPRGGLALRHTDLADLRVREHRRRDETVVEAAQVAGASGIAGTRGIAGAHTLALSALAARGEHVVEHDLRLVVGDVLQLVLAG